MGFPVRVLQTSETFEVGVDESVLEAALRQGVQLRHGCTFGGCGSCRVRLVEGAVRYVDWPLALGLDEAAQGHALVCQARATSGLVISVDRSLATVAEPARHQAVVRGLRAFTPDVVHLSLDIAGVDRVVYRPGQHMNIHLGDGTHRSFSMASPPRERCVDCHVRRVDGGRFTTGRLPHLREGDLLDVELPLGPFGLHRADERPLLMVATGTGIAPIKSMLESLLDDDDCPPVWLYWGMRSAADLYLDDMIRGWQGRLYEFQYAPVLSRADTSWRGRRGHVQQAVLQDLPDLSEHGIYLCGSPAMVAEARTSFLAQGADADHLHADAFTFQHAD